MRQNIASEAQDGDKKLNMCEQQYGEGCCMSWNPNDGWVQMCHAPDGIRTVYEVEVKEIVSRSYYVVARTKSEAIRNYEDNCQECQSEYDFTRLNSDLEVCEIDGSIQWHKSFKPTVVSKMHQAIMADEFGQLQWQDVEYNDAVIEDE